MLVSIESAKKDSAWTKRGDRKLLVTTLRPESERHATETIWECPPGQRCPVVQTKNLEMAVFNETAKQTRHVHQCATEIYVVVDGAMIIEVEDQVYELSCGDSIIVLPGSRHEIRSLGTRFSAYVTTANVASSADKNTAL